MNVLPPKVNNLHSLQAQSFEKDSSSVSRLIGKWGDEGRGKITEARNIAFIAPQLPHVCDLELWNAVLLAQDNRTGCVYTQTNQKTAFEHFYDVIASDPIQVKLQVRYLESTAQDPTFLSGLEDFLVGHNLCVGFGSTAMALYQATKALQVLRVPFVLWYPASRPLGERTLGLPAWWDGDMHATEYQERAPVIFQEVLKKTDLVCAFSKETANFLSHHYAPLWPDSAQPAATGLRLVKSGKQAVTHHRVRLLPWALPDRYNSHQRVLQRGVLRKALQKHENDFIFFHLGGLRPSSGVWEVLHAFLAIIRQASEQRKKHLRLCLCDGPGNLVADTRAVKKWIVDHGLNSFIDFLDPDPAVLRFSHWHTVHGLGLADVVLSCPHSAYGGHVEEWGQGPDIRCAIGLGLSVISTTVGAMAGWLGQYQKLLPPGHISYLKQAMLHAVQKQNDVAKKKHLYKAVRTQFDFQQAVQSVLHVFAAARFHEAVVAPISAPSFVHTRDETFEKEGAGLADCVIEAHNCIPTIEMLVKEQRYHEALQALSQAFALPGLVKVDHGELFRLIGDCFAKLGDWDGAVENYSYAIENHPLCLKAMIGMGAAALNRQEFTLAQAYFQRVFALDENNESALLGLACCAESEGQMGESYSWLIKACESNKDSTLAIFQLMKIAYAQNRFDDAERILVQFTARHPENVNMLFTLAGVYYKKGQYHQASHVLDVVLQKDPHHSQAYELRELLIKNIHSHQERMVQHG